MIFLVLDVAFELEARGVSLNLEYFGIVLVLRFDELSPHVLHYFLFEVGGRHRVLWINKVTLVLLHHHVFAEGTLQQWIVYEYLVVASWHKRRKSEPILLLNCCHFQIWEVEGAHVRQLVVQYLVGEDSLPPSKESRGLYLLNVVVDLQKHLHAIFDLLYGLLLVAEVFLLADAEQAKYWRPQHLEPPFKLLLIVRFRDQGAKYVRRGVA